MFYRTTYGVVGVLCDRDIYATNKRIGEEEPFAVNLEDDQTIQNYIVAKSRDGALNPVPGMSAPAPPTLWVPIMINTVGPRYASM